MKTPTCCVCVWFFLGRDLDVLWEVTEGHIDSSSRKGNKSETNEEERDSRVTGVLNPTACLHLGDVVLFTVDTRRFPQYDL